MKEQVWLKFGHFSNTSGKLFDELLINSKWEAFYSNLSWKTAGYIPMSEFSWAYIPLSFLGSTYTPIVKLYRVSIKNYFWSTPIIIMSFCILWDIITIGLEWIKMNYTLFRSLSKLSFNPGAIDIFKIYKKHWDSLFRLLMNSQYQSFIAD